MATKEAKDYRGGNSRARQVNQIMNAGWLKIEPVSAGNNTKQRTTAMLSGIDRVYTVYQATALK